MFFIDRLELMLVDKINNWGSLSQYTHLGGPHLYLMGLGHGHEL